MTRAEKVNLASKYQNSGRKWIHQGTQISRFGSGSSHFLAAALFVTVDQGVFFLFERSGGVFGAICHTQAASNDRFLQKKNLRKNQNIAPIFHSFAAPSNHQRTPFFSSQVAAKEDKDSRARSRALSINIYGCVRDR